MPSLSCRGLRFVVGLVFVLEIVVVWFGLVVLFWLGKFLDFVRVIGRRLFLRSPE
jgi:hypothetical protein